MVKAIEDRECDDGAGDARSGSCPDRKGLMQILMRPRPIEVMAILDEDGERWRWLSTKT
jgi:hypothetical protein